MMDELPNLDWNTLVKLASKIPDMDSDVEKAFEFAREITIQEPEFLKLVALWVQNGSHLISQNPLSMANILASIANMAFCFGMVYNQSQRNMLESWSDFWSRMPDDEENDNEESKDEEDN